LEQPRKSRCPKSGCIERRGEEEEVFCGSPYGALYIVPRFLVFLCGVEREAYVAGAKDSSSLTIVQHREYRNAGTRAGLPQHCGIAMTDVDARSDFARPAVYIRHTGVGQR